MPAIILLFFVCLMIWCSGCLQPLCLVCHWRPDVKRPIFQSARSATSAPLIGIFMRLNCDPAARTWGAQRMLLPIKRSLPRLFSRWAKLFNHRNSSYSSQTTLHYSSGDPRGSGGLIKSSIWGGIQWWGLRTADSPLSPTHVLSISRLPWLMALMSNVSSKLHAYLAVRCSCANP